MTSSGGLKSTSLTVETLALLSLKCKPRVFDLSSAQAHVSIRDQIVRGRLLARDLRAADRICKEVLVVGAGVAGVSFAVAAASLGVKVVVVDANHQPFALQHAKSSRWVGPFMYEWPAGFFDDQSYPPVHPTLKAVMADPLVPTWSATAPIKSSDLAVSLGAWLKRLHSIWPATTSFPILLTAVNAARVATFVKRFASSMTAGASVVGTNWLSGVKRRVTANPDYVVLAAGMGAENTLLPGPAGISGRRFWQNDNLKSPSSQNWKIGVFGGGDGALQDVLRAVTNFDHPVQFLNHLYSSTTTAAAMDGEQQALAAIEQQNRLYATWTTGQAAADEVDERCREIAQRLATRLAVRNKVRDGVRVGRGQVQLVWGSEHFTKSYLLNRFLVHLIDACQSAAPKLFSGRMQLRLRPSTLVLAAKHGSMHNFVVDVSGPLGNSSEDFDEVAVRFGLKKGSVPGLQMIGLSLAKAERTLLAQIPVPFVLPRL